MPPVKKNGVQNPSAAAPAPAPAHRIATPLLGLAVPIGRLKFDPQNARLHGDSNMDAIKRSLTEFGQVKPIVVRQQNMTVAAGNGTLRAAKELGWSEIAAAVIPMTDMEFTRYGLADNRTAELAEWDGEVVRRLDALVRDAGDDNIGWSANDIRRLRITQFKEKVDPDSVPAIDSIKVVSRIGDVWQMDKHRLMCGDSTSAADVALALDVSPTLIVTDPPYGVSFDREQFLRDKTRTNRSGINSIQGDSRKRLEQQQFIAAAFNAVKSKCLPGCTVYMFSAPMVEGCYSMFGMLDAGIHIQSQLIWNKTRFAMGMCDHHWKHEVCWYGWFENGKHKWYGGRDKSTVLDFAGLSRTLTHPNEKPVDLIDFMINNSSLADDIVCDLFTGSGTTLICCERHNRIFRGIDLDPKFVDLSVRRWEEFTGKKAKLVRRKKG